MKEKIVDHYGKEGWGVKGVARKIPLQRERYVLDFLKTIKGKRFLDVGCGDGFFMQEVKEETNFKEIIGLDYSGYKVKNKRTELNIIRTNIETDLPRIVKDKYFDVVYLGEVIEHVFNPDSLLRVCHAKLKKSGILILSTPNLNSWYNRVLFLFGFQPLFYEVSTEDAKVGFGIIGRIKKGNLPVGHVRIFNIKSLRDILTKEGFEILHIKGNQFESLPKPLMILDKIIGEIFTSLSSDLIVIAKLK